MESLKKADIQDFNLLKKMQNLEDRFEIISNTFQDKVSVNDVKTVCDELIKDKFTEFEAKNDIKSQSKITKIREKVKEYISTWQLHGLMEERHILIKLLFIVMSVSSIGYGLYNITKTVVDYYNFDVITNIERITQHNAPFPSVTICYPNEGIYCTDHSKETDYQEENSINNPLYNFTIKSMVKYAKYKGKYLDLNDLQAFRILNSNGNCVRFNGIDMVTGNNSLETVDRLEDSFEIEIDNYFSENISGIYYEYFTSIGKSDRHLKPNFKAYVGDNYMNSYSNSIPLNLQLGFFSQISIVNTDIEKKLPKPFNPCVDPEDKAYRQTNCIEICINKNVQNKYNCSIQSYYRVDGLESCGTYFWLYDWLYDSIYVENITSEFYDICEGQCSKECHSTKFNVIILGAQKNVPLGPPYYGTNRFVFFVSDFSTLLITQIPKMNFFDLVANIGGTLGLCVGLSLVSMIDLMSFFADIGLESIKCSKSKNLKQTV